MGVRWRGLREQVSKGEKIMAETYGGDEDDCARELISPFIRSRTARVCYGKFRPLGARQNIVCQR